MLQRCCLPDWGTGMCLGWRRGSARSVRDLGHLLLQLGDALVLAADRVLYALQLFQDLVQLGFVLLEDKSRRGVGRRARRAAALTGIPASRQPAGACGRAEGPRPARLAQALPQLGCSGHGPVRASRTYWSNICSFRVFKELLE